MTYWKKYYQTYNEVQIPPLGLGTYLLKGSQGKQSIEKALRLGYRLVDTASMYGNEKEVGEAIRNSGIAREDILITSKVWNTEQGYQTTLDAFQNSLNRLKLDYIDIYLIHWPVKGKRMETWRALEDLYKEGRVRVIGVSNYYQNHLQEILKQGTIKPMINQVEFNPFLYLEKLLHFCKNHEILLEAYAPLSHGYKLKNSTLTQIGQIYQKTPAQILLRWQIQQGTIPIPKAQSLFHLQENINIFDFELSDRDMRVLNALHENYHSDWDPSHVD